MTPPSDERPWLLLIHQLPPKPAYLRVKIWRRLQRLGAVAIKNAVYVLPYNEQAQEDFQWTLREIVAGGGDATVCEARFLEGITDDQVVALFQAARHADYQPLADEARALLTRAETRSEADERSRALEGDLARLRKRIAEVQAIDFFPDATSETLRDLLRELERWLPERRAIALGKTGAFSANAFQRRLWVTRQGVGIDRMASAWLIRRFIDHEARFKFVPAQGYKAAAGEIRFDMFEAEFTHEGDRCTFEVLIHGFGLDDPGLQVIAEIVHDLDLKDDKFKREEVAGFGLLASAIAGAHASDEERLERSAAVFDDLYAFSRRPLS